ncbi:coiled coil domain-containing protein [Legionella quinlivanii]|uniref:Coiled coil domain-containing protein n=1 Tax=Legionella quinlivanii TaxID=45073 RepID=A0A0W0Y025_9GAMM|nr:hypothetical protein [Legionella quinlivanii]KTD50328.1 coiled coil domain-containing protein [Legionella quinlivanii]MCW8449925.1 hypothetical protein [Legionella quinlivanii]SEF43385.1 hypothetical protein SAMN02746093_00175 [Legionella quinlivanii DSM 21216]STY11928.1 coiled coil domain protein [Legionella quinlivanii]
MADPKEVLTQVGSALVSGGKALLDNIPVALIPFGTHLKTEQRMELFSPVSMHKQFKAYETSAKGPDQIKLGSKTPFDDYEKNKVKNTDVFAEIKTQNEKENFGHKINQPSADTKDNANAVKKALEDILVTDAKTTAAQKEYANSVTALNNLLHSKTPRYPVEAVASKLQEANAAAKNAIGDQHKLEKDKLEALFKDDDFKTKLKTTMGLSTDTQLESFKKEMETTLDKAHKDALSKFESSVTEEVKSLHTQAENERRRVAWLATMWHHSNAMQKEIARVAELNKKGQQTAATTISVNVKENGLAIFENVKIEDLEYMEGITGLPMKVEGNGKYSMQLPQFGPLYYNTRHDNVLYDLTSLASAVYATGANSIKMSVNHKDEKWAMELGRRSFEACLRAGFQEGTFPDPKDPSKSLSNITIMVNGKPKTADELFDTPDLQARLQEMRRVAAQQATQRKNYIENPISKTTNSDVLKNALQTEKAKVKDAEAEAEKQAALAQNSAPAQTL